MNRNIALAAGIAAGAATAAGLAIVIGLEARGAFRPSLRARLLYRVVRHTSGLRGDPPKTMALADRRAELEKMMSRLSPRAGIITQTTDAGGVPAEWVIPPNAAEGAVLLYLHGGGYIIGSPATHRDLVSRIAQAGGLRALVPDYRLAPEHPFPAAVEDATAAYRWLLQSGFPAEQIAIAGDSAGGGLTVATLVSLRDAGVPLPAAAVLLSPWTDLALTGVSVLARSAVDPMLDRAGLEQGSRLYRGGEDAYHPLVSPLYAALNGLPPLLIQVGGREVLLHDSTRLAERARAAGVEVTLQLEPDMWHVWQALARYMPEGQAAIDEIGRFIRARLAQSAP